MSRPIPEHENNRLWLFRDKFVIYEAVLNIIVQATAFARVFFLHKGLKNERAIGYLKIEFFWTTLMYTLLFLFFRSFKFTNWHILLVNLYIYIYPREPYFPTYVLERGKANKC